MDKQWVCFFSQTGSEIDQVRRLLGRDPDLIVFNGNQDQVCKSLLHDLESRFVVLPNRPSDQDYEELEKLLHTDSLITLHGWLRIIPGWFCNKHKILNGHPGLITKYPVLKGFNPQEKAFKLGLPSSGSVIHDVVAEVDSGEILASKEVDIAGLTLEEVYEALHRSSVSLWAEFLKNMLN